MDLIQRAVAIAHEAHAGQADKAGEDYISHPRRVAERAGVIAPRGLIEECTAAAWLHDVVEDSSVSLEELREQGIPPLVIEAVGLLTKRPGVARSEYFAAIRTHEVARIVKTADLIDNTDPARLRLLDGSTRDRLLVKYKESWALLLDDI